MSMPTDDPSLRIFRPRRTFDFIAMYLIAFLISLVLLGIGLAFGFEW